MAAQSSRRRSLASAKFPLHYETIVGLNATIEEAFAYLDDFRKLSGHMEKPSAMMMGSRMTIAMDAKEGRTAGAVVRMQGKVLGIPLSLVETVAEHEPPRRKVWQTVDSNLLVIGPYRLGFDLARDGPRTCARIFIDCVLPEPRVQRWLGRLLGRSYARWCTRRMALDALRVFPEFPTDRVC